MASCCGLSGRGRRKSLNEGRGSAHAAISILVGASRPNIWACRFSSRMSVCSSRVMANGSSTLATVAHAFAPIRSRRSSDTFSSCLAAALGVRFSAFPISLLRRLPGNTKGDQCPQSSDAAVAALVSVARADVPVRPVREFANRVDPPFCQPAMCQPFRRARTSDRYNLALG
jgi:hypothetical protein